jgi:hypothetical protein
MSKEAIEAAITAADSVPDAQLFAVFSTRLVKSSTRNNRTSQTARRTTSDEAFHSWQGFSSLQKLHFFAAWLRTSPIHYDN